MSWAKIFLDSDALYGYAAPSSKVKIGVQYSGLFKIKKESINDTAPNPVI